MAGEFAREFSAPCEHVHVASVDFSHLGTTVNIGDVPACVVTDVYVVKTADFNAGSTATIDVGINYSDATTDDPDALVDGAGLTSATALGPIRVAPVDNAAAVISVPATITATFAATGTAASTGAAHIIVKYVPLKLLKAL